MKMFNSSRNLDQLKRLAVMANGGKIQTVHLKDGTAINGRLGVYLNGKVQLPELKNGELAVFEFKTRKYHKINVSSIDFVRMQHGEVAIR